MRLGARVGRLEHAAARGTAADREAEADALFAAIPTPDLRRLLTAARAGDEGRPLTTAEQATVDRHAPALARLAELGGGGWRP